MVALPLFLALLAPAASKEFDIRKPDGAVVITADQILAYDWGTHTITLKPGTRKPLFKAVFGEPGNSTFVAAVGGKEVYRGTWKSVVMSSSSSAVTIVVDRQAIDTKLGEDQIRIELGYPGKAFFKGDDPRNDPAVRAAVKGKQSALVLSTDTGSRELSAKEAEAYKLAAAWLEERMKEAEVIKPGTSYADLAKTFKGDGGLSRVTVHRYVSILCPYLKIDVEFEGDFKKPLAKDAKVKTVSKPYFEREFVD